MTEAQARPGKPSSQNVFPADVAEAGKKQLDALMETQKNFLGTMEEMNRVWTERAQSEASLMMDFMGKLGAARTFPEAAMAWQECMSKQLELLAADGRRLFESSDKAMKSGTRLFGNGGGAFGT